MSIAPKRMSEGAEEAITRAIEAFEDGWNRHDLAAAFTSFAAEADFVNAEGQWWRGRAEILERLGTSCRGRFSESTLRIPSVSIRFLRDDVAVVHLTWTLAGDRAPDGKGLPIRRGILTLMTSRRKSRWTFDAAQNTEQFIPSMT